MKYVCPECKHIGEFEGVFRKQDIECEACMYRVYTPIAKALLAIEAICGVLAVVAALAAKSFGLNIWLCGVFFISLLALWKLAEWLLCRRANAKTLERDF